VPGRITTARVGSSRCARRGRQLTGDRAWSAPTWPGAGAGVPWWPGNAGAARSPSRPLRASPASTSTKSDAGPPGTGGPPLAKPAHAFLDVATAAQRGHHPAPQGLIELTVNEFRRLFDAGLLATHHTISTLLAWSVWRRRHQARARDGPLQTPRIRPAPMITITAVVLEARNYPSHTSTTKEATLSPILGHMASPLRLA